MTYKTNYYFSAAALLLMYVISWQLQNHLLLNFDVSWLSFASKQLLAGGNYINNFLETNPPLILYLYSPLVYLNKCLGISTIIGIRIYIFALATLSLILCSHLLNAILADQEKFTRDLAILALAAICLILPVNEFGQREHLTLILTLPYFLLTALRLQTRQAPKAALGIFIGFLAGLGFCIKPYFLLPLCLTEVYYLYRIKRPSANFRSETLALGFTGCAYAMAIYLFHQDYLHQILPLITQFYYQRYQRSLLRMLTSAESIFTYAVLGLFCLRQKKQPHPELTAILLIGALGFWLAFCAQRMGWYYHALPCLALELLLSVLLYTQLALQTQWSKQETLSLGLLIVGLYLYLTLKLPYINLSAYFFPLAYFSLFFVVLFPLFYINASFKFTSRLAVSLALVFTLNLVFYKYLRLTVFYPHLFLLSTSFFILLFGLAIPASTSVEKSRYLVLAILGLLLFALPSYRMAYNFDYASYYKMLYTQLTTSMKKYAGQKVVYLSNASEMAFPSMDYCGQIYVSRFWSLMWLPTMPHPYDVKTYPDYLNRNREQLAFYLQAVVQDLQQNQPSYVFVDDRQRGHYYYTPPPDYIQLFSLRQDFREQWKHYHYVALLDSPPLYRIKVYQRN